MPGSSIRARDGSARKILAGRAGDAVSLLGSRGLLLLGKRRSWLSQPSSIAPLSRFLQLVVASPTREEGVGTAKMSIGGAAILSNGAAGTSSEQLGIGLVAQDRLPVKLGAIALLLGRMCDAGVPDEPRPISFGPGTADS